MATGMNSEVRQATVSISYANLQNTQSTTGSTTTMIPKDDRQHLDLYHP